SHYDPHLNGLDWPALTRRYLELVREALTPDEFDHVAGRFVGELNSSHQGINSPEPRNEIQQPVGRLGIQHRRVADGYEVVRVFANGPADKGAMRLRAGDVLTAVDGMDFSGSATLDTLLAGKVDREVRLTVRRKIDDVERTIDLLITPIGSQAETALFYNDWRALTARKVDELSGGKIGYIHIRGMDQNSLDVFERDLYAAADGKKGLIIDVRNNGGGWTADRLLASIMYPRHAYTRPRGVSESVRDAYPNDRLFIARYDLPINMLCNEKSFSNAEIVAHAFKTLQRGTLVGQQTAGGVISTGATTLIDGTVVRTPFRGWWTRDHVNMELNGAMPDLLVPQTPEAEARDEDEQLKAAVEDLLKRVE
ncbi:MAG: S41 family peptidase, partial [Phycisphaerae bacterium]|nr:S41 family peptidase [Phycisphaerae bacterium]